MQDTVGVPTALVRCSKMGRGMGREEESSSWIAELGITCQLCCIQQELEKIHPPRTVALHQVMVFQGRKKSCTAPSPVMFSLCSLGIVLETCYK